MDQENKLTEEMLGKVTGGSYLDYTSAMAELCKKYQCTKGDLLQHLTPEEQEMLWTELMK